MLDRDPYQILGLTKNASQQDIENAYKKLRRKHHPDKGGSESEYINIKNAYDTISDPEKRRMHDAGFSPESGFRQNGFSGGFSSFDFDVGNFHEFINSFMRGGDSSGESDIIQGSNILCEVKIALYAAFTGTNVNVSYDKMSKCSSCAGSGVNPQKISICPKCGGRGSIDMFLFPHICSTCSGKGKIISNCNHCKGKRLHKIRESKFVNIPSGVGDGQKLIFKSAGNEGINSPDGSLVLSIKVMKDKKFTRDGSNLVVTQPTNISTMIFGGKISVESIDGKALEVVFERNNLVSKQIIVRGEGMPHYNKNGRGDLHVILEPIMPNPSHMSQDMKSLWEEIYKLENNMEPPKKKRGFF